MKMRHNFKAFTLIELLVVIGIIALLVSILMPSLSNAKELARSANCLSNLHSLGLTMQMYHSDHDGQFWWYNASDLLASGKISYYWGRPGDPVQPKISPFLRYCDSSLSYLWCPSFVWGDYVPQSYQNGVKEPTTTYGYNSFCLAPLAKSPKKTSDVKDPANLFVFNDAATYAVWWGVPVFQNSSYLEPVVPGGSYKQTPTTHFRHLEKTNALCVDGHAQTYGLEGQTMLLPAYNLSFVGTANAPHYDNP